MLYIKVIYYFKIKKYKIKFPDRKKYINKQKILLFIIIIFLVI